MPPFALITRCQGTFPLWKRMLLLLSVGGDGRCLRQTPTCLDTPAVITELIRFVYVTTEFPTLDIPL